MKKTRRIFYLATAVTTVMGIAIACSFPEPRLVGDDGTEGGGGDTGGDTTEEGDAPDGSVADATSESSPPIVDATSEKPPVDAADGCCDCDDDGYLVKDASAICKDSGKPEGDCDDFDKRANPDAGFVTAQPTVDTLGDWNCDGKVNGEHTPVINCGGRTGGALGNCNGEMGFVDNPACGAKSSYVECKTINLTSCTQGPSEEKVQGCK